MSTGHASVEEGKQKGLFTRALHKVAKRTGLSNGQSIRPATQQPSASTRIPDTREVDETASPSARKGWSMGSLGLFGSGHKGMLDNVHDPMAMPEVEDFTVDFSHGEGVSAEREAAGAPTWSMIKGKERPKAMPGGDSRAVRRGDWQKTRTGGFVQKDDGHDPAAQPYVRGEATPGRVAPLKEPTRKQDLLADMGHSMQRGRQKVGSVGGQAVKTAATATEKAHKAFDKARSTVDKHLDSGQKAMDKVAETADSVDGQLGRAADRIHDQTELANEVGVDTSHVDSAVDSAHSVGGDLLSSASSLASSASEHIDDLHGALDDALDFVPGVSEAKSAYRIAKSGAIGMELDSRITAQNLKKSESATAARKGRQSARRIASAKGLSDLMAQKSAVTKEISSAGRSPHAETSSALQQGLTHVETREAQPSLVTPSTPVTDSVKSSVPEREISDVMGASGAIRSGVNIGADFNRVTANGGAKSSTIESSAPRRDPMAPNADYRPEAVKALDSTAHIPWKPSGKLGGSWTQDPTFDPSTRFDEHSDLAGGASQVLNSVGHAAHDVGKAFTGKGHDAEIAKLSKSTKKKDLKRARKLAALNVGAAGAKLGTSIAAPGASQALSLSAHVADKGGKMLADATQGRSDEQDVVDRVRHRESPEFLKEVAANKAATLGELPKGHAEMQDKLHGTGEAYDAMVAKHERRIRAEQEAEKRRPQDAKLGPWLAKEGMDRSAGSERSNLPHYRPEARPKTAAIDPDFASMNALFGEKRAKSESVDPEHHSMNRMFGSDRSQAAAVDPEHHSMNRLLGSARTQTPAVAPEHDAMNDLFADKKRNAHLAEIRAAGERSTDMQADKPHAATTPVAEITKKEFSSWGQRIPRFARNAWQGTKNLGKRMWKGLQGFFGN